MADIDPVKFGLLIGQVNTLEAQVCDLQKDVKALLELANKSKGGFWVGMAIVSAISGAAAFIMDRVFFR